MSSVEFLLAWGLVVKECFCSAGKTIPSLKMTPTGMKRSRHVVWVALQHHLKWALLSVTFLFINPEKTSALLDFYIFIWAGLQNLPFLLHLFDASGLRCHNRCPLVIMQMSVWVTNRVMLNVTSPVVGGDAEDGGLTMCDLTIIGR